MKRFEDGKEDAELSRYHQERNALQNTLQYDVDFDTEPKLR